ncbi:hypothetical protein D3C72_1828140 [compost metagenome]
MPLSLDDTDEGQPREKGVVRRAARRGPLGDGEVSSLGPSALPIAKLLGVDLPASRAELLIYDGTGRGSCIQPRLPFRLVCHSRVAQFKGVKASESGKIQRRRGSDGKW